MADSLSSDLASLRIARDESGPSRSGSFRTVLLGVGTLAVIVLAVLRLYPYLEASLFKTPVQLTEILLVSPAQATTDLTSTGYVVPDRSSKVGAKAAGRLARVLVQEGQVVKAGEVLAVLEDGIERSAIATARARVKAARARVLTARANLAEAQLRLEREESLASRGATALSSAQDQKARVLALAEAVKAADAEVGAADAEVAALEVSLGNMTVTAPLGGTVVTRPLRPGELVGPTSGPILELADLASLVVETDVPEARLARVKPGAPCEITLDAFPTRRLRGEALEIVPRVNRAKATVVVKVKFVDPPTGVLPDMAARVSFLQKALDEKSLKEQARLVVPSAAITERGGAKVVFAIDPVARDTVRLTTVQLGPALGGGFELLAPALSAGTRLVKAPLPTLSDGQRIKESDKERSE